MSSSLQWGNCLLQGQRHRAWPLMVSGAGLSKEGRGGFAGWMAFQAGLEGGSWVFVPSSSGAGPGTPWTLAHVSRTHPGVNRFPPCPVLFAMGFTGGKWSAGVTDGEWVWTRGRHSALLYHPGAAWGSYRSLREDRKSAPR